MAPPAPPPKKRRGGCCGCGCALTALILVLILAFTAGSAYLTYNFSLKITEAEPAQIPTFDGGDEVFNRASQKLETFNDGVKSHTATTLRLTSDEINTLIARNSNLSRNRIQVFVTLTDDQGHIQGSVPTGLISQNLLKGRFLNLDSMIGIGFDTASKKIAFDLKSLKAGPVEAPANDLPLIQTETDGLINGLLDRDANAKAFLGTVTSIEIKNSELVIEAD